jgi:gluconokinase
MTSLVIMGVAGCGKSSLGVAVARDRAMRLVEGDERHSASSLTKMREGIALTDADRAGWLDALASELVDERACNGPGLVVTCSALRRAYRDRLRRAVPNLRFIFLEIARADAMARVAARPGHFFSASLVDSQFATLESPQGEPGVFQVNALTPLTQLRADVSAWLNTQETL